MHWCDEGLASWYDVACAVGDVALDLGLISKCAKVHPIESKDFPLQQEDLIILF